MSAINSEASHGSLTPLAEPLTASVGEGLTRKKLYRFGAVIGAAILILTVVSEWSTRNQTDQLALRNGIADTRDHVLFGDMFHDEIRATVFAGGLESKAALLAFERTPVGTYGCDRLRAFV